MGYMTCNGSILTCEKSTDLTMCLCEKLCKASPDTESHTLLQGNEKRRQFTSYSLSVSINLELE